MSTGIAESTSHYHYYANYYPTLIAYPHHSPTAVVVQVHQCSGVFYHSLPGIHKGFGELDSIIHIVATATPVKVTHFVMRPSSLLGVTAAAL